jgi:D-3-phosphoglycerate dehydrogenase
MSGLRILVADELSAEGMAILRGAGEVTFQKGLSGATLAKALLGKQALVVRSATQVTAEALAGADQLLVIGRAGIGVDNIDVDAATARGIVVMNTPESGAVTTGELAIAMLLSLARHIPGADRAMHEGKWEKSRFTGVEITGKTLGILGLGRIGRVVADRALGLKLRVLAYDPYLAEDRMPPGVVKASLDRCLAESDFLSVHVPLMDTTRYLLDEKAFAKVKPGCRLVHCARGGIVQESALIQALVDGRLAGAALDVFEQEPLPKDSPLLQAPNLIMTPHLGASTEEARRAVGIDIAQQVVSCLRTGTVVNGVNVPYIHPSEAEFLSPFLSLAERLASLLGQLWPGRLERVQVVTQGEVGEKNQRPVLVAALVGALKAAGLGPVTPVNAEAISKKSNILVESSRTTLKKDFVNLVRVELQIDGTRHLASGTLIGRRHLRMVELDDFLLDAIPEGRLLITRHRDVPGVIGRAGTLLGEAQVNISRLQLGQRRDRQGEAMGVFNIDSEVPPPILTRLRELPEILSLTQVGL